MWSFGQLQNLKALESALQSIRNKYILGVEVKSLNFDYYYVVLKGNINSPAIFTDYADCEKVVTGCEDAKIKAFKIIEDAFNYLIGNEVKSETKEITDVAINVVSYKVNEVDFEEINSKYSDTICIYVSGGYDSTESTGHYVVLIKKFAKFKLIKKDAINISTANRALIYSIIDSLDYISDNNEMEITVFVATSLGFKKADRNKGPNVDLILELFDKVTKKNLKITCVEMLGKSQEIKDYINLQKH